MKTQAARRGSQTLELALLACVFFVGIAIVIHAIGVSLELL
jgi:hypothetical protein